MQLTANFSLAELTVTGRNMPNFPNEAEVASLSLLAKKILQPLRDALGQPVLVNSAFRSEAVIRYDDQDGRGSIVAGTVQSGSGDGKGFGIIRGGASDTFQLLARPNGTVTFMPAANIVGARGGWMFIAMTFEVGSRAWKAYVGGASMVSNVLAQAYAKSARNLALGNAYYVSSTTPYDGAVSHAEMIVFDHALTKEELDAVYARSRSRMASRGITLY